MNVERFEKLKACYDLKNRNGVDSSVEFWAMIEEYVNDEPNMNLEELRQLTLDEYCKLFKGFPDVDAVTSIQQKLKYLNELINEFENIVKLKVSEMWKLERLAEEEKKLSILLEYLSEVILDYVGAPNETHDEENSILWQEDESLEKEILVYMRALHEKVNIHNSGITIFYYHRIIPFYRKLFKTTEEALNHKNNDVLWQVAEVSTCRIVFRSKIMAYILS